MSYDLKVSLDGGRTYQSAPEGVRVIYSGLEDEGREGELHLNHTHEGVVTDVWEEPEPGQGVYPKATDSQTVDEIVARLT